MSINLHLERPIVFLKVSTTGINIHKDRIVEISLIKINVDRRIEKGVRLINPGIPIPVQATEIHKITDSDVADKPVFEGAIASGIYSFVEGCDFAGYNVESFDLPFLIEEFNRAKIPFNIYGKNIIDLSNIYHMMEPTGFEAAYNMYCKQELDDDAMTTEKHNILSSQMLNGMMLKYVGQSYQDNKILAKPSVLNEMFRKNSKNLDIKGDIVMGDNGVPTINFGQFKGMPVAETMLNNIDYFEWAIGGSNLPSDTKGLLKKIVDKANENIPKA